MKRVVTIGVLLLAAALLVAHFAGVLPGARARANLETAAKSPVREAPRPAVSVVAATPATFTETVLVTGSLVARHEVLISPEVEGLRIVALGAEEGERVAQDHVLARLEPETLDAQLAQNAAALERAGAAIAQARSQIRQAEARLDEARANFERAAPLRKSGAVSEATYDQREAAARTSEAQLAAARDGLKLAEAERAQIEAQRRELVWKRSRTEVRAPIEGLISRRNARVGALASAQGEPMFRMASAAEMELEAEVPEAQMGRLRAGQTALIALAGAGEHEGQVRLVSPEVDRQTRLGKVRIFLGAYPALRIGAFGRGQIRVASSRGLAIPASAAAFGPDGVHVLTVVGDTVGQKRIEVGLSTGDLIEVRSGLAEGELVVSKAGTFLRPGDRVRPVVATRQTAAQAR